MWGGAGGAVSPPVRADGSARERHQGRETSAPVMERCLLERLLYHPDGFLTRYKSKIVLPCRRNEQLFLLPRMKCWIEKGTEMKTKSEESYLFNINLFWKSIGPISGLKNSTMPILSLHMERNKLLYGISSFPSPLLLISGSGDGLLSVSVWAARSEVVRAQEPLAAQQWGVATGDPGRGLWVCWGVSQVVVQPLLPLKGGSWSAVSKEDPRTANVK